MPITTRIVSFSLVLLYFLQSRTMQMMYEMIYKALEEVGLHKTYEPQDYLNFFCLGNREVLDVRDGVEAGNGEKNAQVLSPYPLD